MAESRTDGLERLYSLHEAAEALGVTAQDVSDPARWVRDKIRALRVPYVRAGRVVKLPESSLRVLREAMMVRDTRAESGKLDLPHPSGRSASTLRVLARLDDLRKKKPAR